MAKPKKSRRSNNSSDDDDDGGNFGQRVSIQPSANNSYSNNEFTMDRILCRAYSLDSNISDLSGSLGGPRLRGASNVASTSANENIFMSIVNDCAALAGISEVVAQGQEALFGGTTGEKGSRRKKHSQPNVWGVSPTNDDSSSDDDATKPKKSLTADDDIHHDNIELVLDNNSKASASTVEDPKPSSKPNLKNRVSSALRRPSPVGGDNSSATNNDFGPSLLDENEDAGQGSTGKESNQMPMNQANTSKEVAALNTDATADNASMASGQKKSQRKLFRFPLNPSKKITVTKKKLSSSKPYGKQATREQIEEAKKWKSTIDTTTGKAYYYNSETKTTAWEKPVGYDEACEELASADSKESVSEFWNATLDASTGRTYYYNKKTKEVSWTIPKGYKGSVRGDKKGKSTGEQQKKKNGSEKNAEDGSAKYWRKTVDATTGKTYYFNKKTKMVSWEKPAGVVDTSSKKIDENADAGKSRPEPLKETPSSPSSSPPSFPSKNSRGNTGNGTPLDEEPPDAPFDEPDGAHAPSKKAQFVVNKNAEETSDAMPLYSRTKSLKSIELTKQRTYASAMTDTTKKVANTGQPAKDFTNTQINVINDTEDGESSQKSSPKVPPKRGQTTPTKSSSLGVGKTPIVSPSSPKRPYRTKKAENLGSDDESDLDDWSDEVSALSGIGNEVDSGVKGSRNKHQKDSRTVRS
jgi:hypothetical protein